ncbi:MAG: glutamine-hydrolyzing carbamoyl-phosphate synthase small subunit [Bacteroidia bacterium]|jgi:carbamoyl-phosphate synthase small subunit|nr:glutamine-hydrolyzing carbamoyl-phosphate synthase small subunit [Bacteroidia bacterium]
MKYTPKSPALLLLEDGTVFYGKAAGAIGIATGEICFNTGMTGYQEIFTDPSYTGQLMVMTSVHIGNYGIKLSESESTEIKISGLICRNLSPIPSRKDSDMSIQDFLLQNKMVTLTDVDTRAIVRHIRSKGSMNAIISTATQDIETLKKELAKVPSMEGLELSSQVSSETAWDFNTEGKMKVALLDAGYKMNIARSLADRGCQVRIFPYNSTFAEMNQWQPDGYMLSNGPGDPATMHDAVKTVKEILDSGTPLFGICLGHQLLAEACGMRTYKMHHGHRGINHPVKNVIQGTSEITSQNHGFAVMQEDIENSKEVEITHFNLNDKTIEGIRMKSKPAFSVQYHPEAAPGPHDAAYLFDDFVSMIKDHIKQKVASN